MADHDKILMWVDLETDALPTAGDGIVDFRNVNIMEIAVILTDHSLNILQRGGYTEAMKLTKAIFDNLKGNDFVRKMHNDSGLIQACSKSTVTLPEADEIIFEMLSGEFGASPGEVAIAGSGVAAFDHPLIKAQMPRTASMLAYYPYDYGIFRRLIQSLAGGMVTNPHISSYGKDKVHRALNDIEAHLREAQKFRDWVRKLPSSDAS